MNSLLTTAQLAEYLGVAKVTIHHWIKDKALPRKKVGHLNRFVAEEVEAWIAEQTQRADAQIASIKEQYPRLGRRDPHQSVTFTLD